VLQIGQARNRVAGRASPGIARPEADQKAADHDHDEAGEREEPLPAENRSGGQAFRLLDTDGLKVGHSGRGDAHHGIWRGEEGPRNEAADDDPEGERQVPQALGFPVVLEERRLRGKGRRADVPEVRRDAELAAGQEQQRHHQADQDPGDVPRPRL
jgi:hypothetical protein